MSDPILPPPIASPGATPMTNEVAKCALCGEPMPEGEEMFKYHGYSGPCPKPPLPKPPSIFDVRSYDARVVGDWNADVPLDVQRELMACAKANSISMDYLCAIYRKGVTDTLSAGSEPPR